MTRYLVLIALAGMVIIIGAVLMVGWCYEGPRRLLKIIGCYIGWHGLADWGVNPINQNSEPYCRDCHRFMAKAY
jgi:hypothetical protein